MMEELIKKVFKSLFKSKNFSAKVLEVDYVNNTITCQPDDGPEKFDVLLNAVIREAATDPEAPPKTSVTIYPKVGSYVLCGVLDNNPTQCFVIKASEVEAVLVEMDGFGLLVNEEQIKLGTGENGGLVKWQEAKAELDKTNEVVSAIQEALTNWVPAPGDGGAALKTLFTSAIGLKQVGSFEDLEDDKVIH